MKVFFGLSVILSLSISTVWSQTAPTTEEVEAAFVEGVVPNASDVLGNWRLNGYVDVLRPENSFSSKITTRYFDKATEAYKSVPFYLLNVSLGKDFVGKEKIEVSLKNVCTSFDAVHDQPAVEGKISYDSFQFIQKEARYKCGGFFHYQYYDVNCRLSRHDSERMVCRVSVRISDIKRAYDELPSNSSSARYHLNELVKLNGKVTGYYGFGRIN